jgi:hypothetical protein
MDWQPIETAPKGVKIIVFGDVPGRSFPQTMVARFWPQYTLPVAEGYEDEDWAEQSPHGESYMPADWYEETMGEEAPAVNLKPTHWMPLPAPPTNDTK